MTSITREELKDALQREAISLIVLAGAHTPGDRVYTTPSSAAQ